jgi:hypothetical protein
MPVLLIVAIAIGWSVLIVVLLALGRAAALGDEAIERAQGTAADAAAQDPEIRLATAVRTRSDEASAERRRAGAGRAAPTIRGRAPGGSSPPGHRLR